ncbi:MAG: hypothetical protein P8Q41_07480 [Saprospiraceae bacterium]|nr:hypothetical protein [Saprospiraceae bacterium]
MINHYSDGTQTNLILDLSFTNGNGEPRKLDLTETGGKVLVA